MEPQIRYVRSADGTTIAVATMGSGPPLVLARGIGHWTGMEGDMADTRRAAAFEELSTQRTLVRYDPRGAGLSQRDVDDVTLAAHIADLRAVIESLKTKSVGLWAVGPSVAPAISYAADHPDRVSRLVLVNPTTTGRERRVSDRRRMLAAVLEYDPDLWRRFVLLMDLGWEEGARVYKTLGSNVTSNEMLLRQGLELRTWDSSGELGRIGCPVLVIHVPTPDAGNTLNAAREVAAEIPDARFRPLEWDLTTMSAQEAQAVQDFLDEDEAPAGEVPTPTPGTAIILFADIVDSTALTERMGDAAFRAKARDLDDALRTIIRDNGGVAIDGKLLGDGVLATFPAASQAIAAALATNGAADTSGLALHVGIHAGDVIRESSNVFGGAVNIASRISGLSAPGEVLVSDVVRSLARTSAGVTFEDRGEHALKGIAEPQRIYAVRAAEGG